MATEVNTADENTRWKLIPERIAELRKMVNDLESTLNWHECEVVRDMLSDGLVSMAEQIERLKRFYNATTLEQLALEQASHVEKLQARLPQMAHFGPQRVREG